MPDPQQHADDRGTLESLLRKIPGFQGYLEKSYRRDSDRLQREYLANRLQRAKQGVNDFALALTNAGKLDELSVFDKLMSRLDRVISRLRGSVSGFSGFFDLVQIDEDVLEEVYAHDVDMTTQVEVLAKKLEDLPDYGESPSTSVSELLVDLASVEAAIDRREDILKGVGE